MGRIAGAESRLDLQPQVYASGNRHNWVGIMHSSRILTRRPEMVSYHLPMGTQRRKTLQELTSLDSRTRLHLYPCQLMLVKAGLAEDGLGLFSK
jgi:hypothetical protein